MMATTHVLAGVLVGVGLHAVAPGAGAGPTATTTVLAGGLGGLAPDFDLLGEHRKDLHFPAYGSLAALLAVVVAVAVPAPATLAAAAFLLAAALHAVSDAVGGDLELRPWEATGDRAVYEHLRGRWHGPHRWVRYDGAPEDFLLGVALAIPALATLSGPGRAVVAALLVVSAVYALVRRRLVDAGERAVGALPESVLAAVPETVIEDLR
ncbi:metal-dependent hydrolase [Halobaculum sp. CBA1158]|uniref:metal-dependent hydrolase n=1 Tax=Halobaculum sp. CBA1158 TaxID=2904243 RepID=UPI001F366FCE|nr:metal-dependent hydrolase [Halobaculum sp. CBA1158]UIO99646.1 metal-dependent hydrolase [Halobaculum sp. CBA1158]